MSFKCNKCGDTFDDKRYLKSHLSRKIPCDRVLQCNTCHKKFKKLTDLQRHNNRKTPCTNIIEVHTAPIDEFNCKYCNKQYSTKSSLKRHIDSCVVKTSNSEIKNELAEMKKKILELERDRCVINNTIIDNRQVIIVVSFENTNLANIAMDQIMYKIQESVDDKLISNIIGHIHNNPDYPENMNVYMTDINDSDVMVFSTDIESKTTKWQPKSKDEIIQQLTNEATKLVFDENDRPRQSLTDHYSKLSRKEMIDIHDKLEKMQDSRIISDNEREEIQKTLISIGKKK